MEGAGPKIVLLDLSKLTFLDSTGLRCVVRADERAREEGRRLVVVKGPEAVQRVFEITRLQERLELVDDAARCRLRRLSGHPPLAPGGFGQPLEGDNH